MKNIEPISLGLFQCKATIRDSEYYPVGDSLEASYHYETRVIEMTTKDFAEYLEITLEQANKIVELTGKEALTEGLCEDKDWYEFCSNKYDDEHYA